MQQIIDYLRKNNSSVVKQIVVGIITFLAGWIFSMNTILSSVNTYIDRTKVIDNNIIPPIVQDVKLLQIQTSALQVTVSAIKENVGEIKELVADQTKQINKLLTARGLPVDEIKYKVPTLDSNMKPFQRIKEK